MHSPDNKIVKISYAHDCIYCHEPIHPNSEVRLVNGLEGGKYVSEYSHLDCPKDPAARHPIDISSMRSS